MVSSAVRLPQSVVGGGGARAQHARGDGDVAARGLARALGGMADSSYAAYRVARTARASAHVGRGRDTLPPWRQSPRAKCGPDTHAGGARALAPALAGPRGLILYNCRAGGGAPA